MSIISLRMNDDEEKLIKEYAEVNNMSISELLRSSVLEKIENDIDLNLYHQAGIIMAWIKKNLVETTNPRKHGKSLSANRAGEWRYRIGDYRLIAHIDDEKVTILVLEIGHRREIYK